ncbi:MAG TPA: SxtJ family membrane protein [Candidatus Hydrogenedentes bacterium]|nr:SxtJ family membrane protein [Candidatus Hydrogenedentota bacterium]HPU97132.1 SxtJ family membrane protein [Candidatus Hydrogenedentota bacterium]
MIDIDTSSRSEQRKFGLVMAAAIAALGFLRSAWHHGLWHMAMPWGFLAVAAVFAGLGLAAPGLLRPVLVVWIRFAEALNWLVTRILLTVVFVFLLTPMGIWSRLRGHDPLKRGFLPPDQSYWEPPEAVDTSLEGFRKQY